MTRTMKTVVAAAAVVLVLGAGFAVAAARPWRGPSYSSPVMAGSMNNGGMMPGRMMNGSMMPAGMMPAGMMAGVPMGPMMGGTWATGDTAPPAIEGARVVTVTADDLRFSSDTLNLTVDEPVNIVVRNPDQVVHDFTVPALGIHLTVQPGQDATFGLRPTTIGTYMFLCTVDGHAAAGMRGTITISS